jgi:hypothetical protein
MPATANVIEYAGLALAIRISLSSGGPVYRAQRTRLHIHGDLGDTTSGEDGSKKRIGTVQDWELTITKASFDEGNNPFDAPFNFLLFGSVPYITIYPGGVTTAPVSILTGGMLDDIELDQDANMLQPLSLHFICANGNAPAPVSQWLPTP